jgi:tyrosyl-tRNA synthetase
MRAHSVIDDSSLRILMTPERQFEHLARGTEEILPEGALLERLRLCARENRPLRVKQGFDPTAPDIHLGHTVGLRKLRQFQDLGHQVVLIVGDYTGMVGDPSGISRTRPQLTEAEVEANARTYLEQFFRVLDREPAPPRRPVEVHRNGEWFAPMRFMDVLRLASRYTVSQMIEREDFSKRYDEGQPIGIHELLYPLMQGYDSVAIRADVELGATEQKFNLIVGRELQRIHGQPQQVVLTVPVLPGVDGVQRMSKSLGNYIGVTDPPSEMFGKIMRLPDHVMGLYWRLVADLDDEARAAVEARLNDSSNHPMELKKALGERIVTLYHGPNEAGRARRDFEAQFSRRETPETLDEFSESEVAAAQGHVTTPGIVEYLVAGGIAASKSAARRLVEQGAVSLDGAAVTGLDVHIDPRTTHVIRAGRKMKRYVPRRGPEKAAID